MKTKLEYVLAQLRKARNKSYEAYVINRIWSGLNTDDIKMICQQHISRPEGRALTDMYFPQLHLHIEIDEAHHLNQIDSDSQREADIIDATSHEIWRIPITKDGKTLELKDLNALVDHYTKEILIRVKSLKTKSSFKPWTLEEHSAQYWIDKGEISTTDDCSFHYNHEAANCFGLNLSLKSIWTGGRTLPDPYKFIWFPKLYQNGQWFNEEISNIIIEKYIVDGSPIKHPAFEDISTNPNKQERIVFAHVKDNLGSVMYRFKGLYTLDLPLSHKHNTLVWKLKDTTVKTYPHKP